MIYLYKKTTSTGTTIGITEATSERNLAERVLAAIPKDETIIALSGDALPDGLITLPALMDAVQELMAKEDNAHAADPNHIIEIAGETGMRLAPCKETSVFGKIVHQMIEKEAADKDACDDCDNTGCPCHPDYEEDDDEADDCDGDCANCECKEDCEEDDDDFWKDEDEDDEDGGDSDFLSFLKNAINAYENRHNNNHNNN